MEFIQKNIDYFQDIDNKNENIFHKGTNERLSYLYPYGHRITHQMRWFKGSNDRGFGTHMTA